MWATNAFAARLTRLFHFVAGEKAPPDCGARTLWVRGNNTFASWGLSISRTAANQPQPLREGREEACPCHLNDISPHLAPCPSPLLGPDWPFALLFSRPLSGPCWERGARGRARLRTNTSAFDPPASASWGLARWRAGSHAGSSGRPSGPPTQPRCAPPRPAAAAGVCHPVCTAIIAACTEARARAAQRVIVARWRGAAARALQRAGRRRDNKGCGALVGLPM